MKPPATKTILLFLSGCMFGLIAGWYAGYLHPRTTAIRRGVEYLERSLDQYEPEYVGPSLQAMRVIPLIESGQTNEAVQSLSDWIANYYRSYASTPGTNDYRRRARDVIEAMAKTNTILANRIAFKMTNQPWAGYERIWMEEWKSYIYVKYYEQNDSATHAEPAAAGDSHPPSHAQ